ncbi:beta strand repeat-containing protein [Clostridium scatologenes]|uniref:Uncharacterized protein n=1 Tax=Clostridium scatologenes TaxID=1548 RepID=A0A0E3M7L2_CLOSL|nr:hypothetical protein [Clostridium scatologenes]AKA70863.1 hypothetical protein CSCA_3738 [Clostridium scatologenes]
MTVNGVAGNTTAGTDKFDFQKPTIDSVSALDAKTIVVNFSEKVDSVTALSNASYTLYNVQTGDAKKLDGTTLAGFTATAAFTDASQKSVKLVLTVPADTAGYPMNGLSNGNYMLYVTGVNDVATIPNTIVANSNVTFTGTTTPSTTAPILVSSTFNSASGAVTLTFDKPTTGAAPADDKVSFQVGSNTVLLKNATDFTGIAAGSTVSFTVAPTTLAKINALGANPQIVLADSAFTDGTNATVAATSTPSIVAGPVLNSVTYDENTNTVVYKFSKTIDVTKITTFTNKFKLGGVYIDANAAAKFNNTANSTDLSFKLSDADAQAIELLLRGGALTASVDANTVQDTDATPNKNVTASSSATLVAGTTYTKDTTAPNLVSAKFNADSKVLALTFDKAVRNDVSDLSLANIKVYKDDNGTAGLQTTGNTPDTVATPLTGITNGSLVTDATGAHVATADTESTTIYIKDVDNAGAANIGTILAAVPAGTDLYVDLATGAVKDANTNATTSEQSVKVTNVAISNSSAITSATTVVPNNLGSVTVSFKNVSGSVAMDSTTATNPANYNLYLTANPLAKVEISSISMSADNTAATLLLKTPLTASSTSYSINTTGIKTATGAAGDINSSILVSPATAMTFNSPAAAEVATNLATTGTPTLTDTDKSGTVTAGDKIDIVFNEPIKLPAGFDASSLTVSGGHSLGTSTVALSADAKTLTITVGSGATIVANDTITLPLTITNYENTALDTTKKTTAGLVVANNNSPIIKSAVYTDTNADGKVDAGDTLVVTFDQNVTAAEGATLTGDFKLNTDATKVSAVTLNGATATLTLKDGADLVGGNVTITAAQTDINNVWGSHAVDATGKAVTYSDTTAPTVTGISYKAHALTFTFSEAVNDLTKTNANDLAAALAAKLNVSGGSLGTAYTVATLSNDGKSVTITLDGTEALDQYSTISIAAGAFGTATNELKDASGNVAVRGQGTPYTLTITQ